MLLRVPIAFVALSMLPVSSAQADSGFDSVARRIEGDLGAKRMRVPLLRVAALFARPFGVRGLHLAIYEKLNYSRFQESAELDDAVRAAAGPGWKTIVKVHERGREMVHIYAKSVRGGDMEVLIFSVDRQAVLIQMTVNPERMAWILNHPKRSLSASAGR